MDLAIFSGKPRFATPQHVGGPIVEAETRERFHRMTDEAFARNYLTNDGPFARRLEEEVASRHGVRHAVLVANATLAQLVLMKAMAIPPGDAVVSSNTFVSTAHICEWLGLRPVFADLDPGTLNLDPADLDRCLTPDTRVVIPTHVFGVFADVAAIRRRAEAVGARVLVDAAHAFDCDTDGVPPGHAGVPEFVSFHATKFFSTIEGGAILTQDDALAREVRELRNFGFTDPGIVTNTGTNAKASELNAAFGLASLPALPGRQAALREVRELYEVGLSDIPGLRIHPLDERGRNNYRYFAVFVEDAFGASRDAVQQALRRENVLARLYFHPGCHRVPYYRRRFPDSPPLPATERALDSILCLPTSFVDVDAGEAVPAIARLLAEIRRRAEVVEAWWREQKDKDRI